MIVKELLEPKSIVVIGGSNDITKPGGRVLKNLLDGEFKGTLYVLNPKEDVVQGVTSYNNISDLPKTELAIIAIAAKHIYETIQVLANEKGTKAFIVLSAGFSEVGHKGAVLEKQIVELVESVGGTLIGPNCIGVLTPHYQGSFAGPMPKLDPMGCDFVSGSGATAVFILETAIPMGIKFASLFSVGNSAQIGVEDVLKYWDETFDPETSSRTKIIYIEQVEEPQVFLKHVRSLVLKGCRIAAIKAGTTEAGSRAVSSHTGSLAGSDTAVNALFKKSGIVRCYSREELAYVAGIFQYKELKGKNLAVITHAGGPGVMLTDSLSKGGLKVPHIEGEAADELLSKLHFGSSVANPIDFLATGNAEQLGEILEYVDNKFDNIDASVVIFGTPGLFDVTDVYNKIDEKNKTCKKPIYPVMPSVIQAKKEMKHFKALGNVCFQDEVRLGDALSKVFLTPEPPEYDIELTIQYNRIRSIIENAQPGFISALEIQGLLDSVGIPRVQEVIVKTSVEALEAYKAFNSPVVMKSLGPIHKSDSGGVRLFINSEADVISVFDDLMQIEDTTSVLIQKMIPQGLEIFVGAKYEPPFGHIILCGLGGIYIEVLKDISYCLCPVSKNEALSMIRELKTYQIIKGVRGKTGINEELFAEIIVKLSTLLQAAPEIDEIDINPLIGTHDSILSVDARIKRR